MAFSVADLGGLTLGEAVSGHVTLDDNAAGVGWYVDPTPADSSEFPNEFSDTRAQTNPNLAPAGKVDLLTTIEHELGHELGLGDTYASADRDSLMYGYLVVGERRAPSYGEAFDAIPGDIATTDFLLGPIGVGALSSGDTVTVEFQATVDSQTNGLIVNPVNAATVTYDSGATATSNATTTTVDSLTLGDRIFNDANGNGVLDGGESGLGNIALTLYADTNANGTFDAGTDTEIATTTTAADGTYSFSGLAPGSYIVQVDQSNFDSGGLLAGVR